MGSVRKFRWAKQWPHRIGRCRYFLAHAWLVVPAILLLSGCMEALQSGQSTVGFPPSALPSATSTLIASPEAAITLADPSVTVPDLTSTATMTAEPTLALPATSTAVIVQPSQMPVATFVLPTQAVLTYEQRWRTQQIDRMVFDQKQTYTTLSSELWWYDPINQQHVILGTFSGDFLAQAHFTLRGQGIEALEVPYQVNVSYGLTALSPALVSRIRAAESGEWIETYVFVTPNIALR